jgi:hypothetical protein
VPEREQRTAGPDGASFFDAGPPEGRLELARGELIDTNPRHGAERLELHVFPGMEEPADDALLLQWTALENRHRLTYGTLAMALAGERFQVSRVRPGDGTPGGVTKYLRERHDLTDYWVKAAPWPFPEPFRTQPREIDVRAVAGELRCEAVVLCDPAAAERRAPAELLLVPVYPENC